ncbi:MAG TPA: metalloregulator ArsR/SmtB family transcription factor [Anaerolineae bacterium]|nr:metalloregulator ArsR/SmtB family transcription factor [Anaerolineae bacterium]HQH37617.1 metalloregulator ArsR/SmtB family transcription factor [Anaerolineae bacterium]
MSEKELRRLTKSFGALHSVLRLRILAALAAGESNVRDLETTLRVSQPLLSWHLTQLRQTGFVVAERVGREVHYRLNPEAFRELADNIEILVGISLSDEGGRSGGKSKS